MLRNAIDLRFGDDPAKWEELLSEARKKRALDLYGHDDVDELTAEDDGYVEITEFSLIELGERAHIYIPMLRPASSATLPDGVIWEYTAAPTMPSLVNRPDLPASTYRYGVIKTSRRLTHDECTRCGLQKA